MPLAEVQDRAIRCHNHIPEEQSCCLWKAIEHNRDCTTQTVTRATQLLLTQCYRLKPRGTQTVPHLKTTGTAAVTAPNMNIAALQRQCHSLCKGTKGAVHCCNCQPPCTMGSVPA